jgi:hypothetical protein
MVRGTSAWVGLSMIPCMWEGLSKKHSEVVQIFSYKNGEKKVEECIG